MGAPPITTWLNAMNKGWFTSFPGLTSSRVRQFCANKIETSKEHMKTTKAAQVTRAEIPTERVTLTTGEVTHPGPDVNKVSKVDLYPALKGNVTCVEARAISL